MASSNPTFPGTVSLLHNNLTVSRNGWLATAHNSVNAGCAKLMLHHMGTAASKDGPEAQQVTSIRFLDLACGPVLCISSTSGTQIYNEDATTMLYFVALNDPTPDNDVLKHHQGACCVSPHQHIILGTSKGSLNAVHATAFDKFMSLPESAPSSPTTGVADVCYAACVDRVVSAHQSGELRYWWAAQGGQYCNDVIIPATASGQAPVHVAALGPRLVVAFGPGTICLIEAASRELQVEITAHARWITAVTVREDIGQIASVGEDTALNVWQVDPASGQIGLAHTSIVADKLLTGVVFHSAGCAVTAYDSDELFSVAVAPPVA
jgi:hypothetical protein